MSSSRHLKTVSLIILTTLLLRCEEFPLEPIVNRCESMVVDSIPFAQDSCVEFPNMNFFKNISAKDLYTNPSLNPCNHNELVYTHRNTENFSKELWKIDLCTGESQMLAEGVLYQADWGTNGWIVFEAENRQIWKIKQNGDSLIQLTFDGLNDEARWIPYKNQIVQRRVKGSNAWLMLLTQDGTVIDSFSNYFSPNGVSVSSDGTKWAYETGWNQGLEIGLAYYDVSLNKEIVLFRSLNDSLLTIGGISWLNNDQDIVWTSRRKGVLLTNILQEETKQVLPICEGKYYGNISGFRDNKIFVERIDREFQEPNIIYSEAIISLLDISEISKLVELRLILP